MSLGSELVTQDKKPRGETNNVRADATVEKTRDGEPVPSDYILHLGGVIIWHKSGSDTREASVPHSCDDRSNPDPIPNAILVRSRIATAALRAGRTAPHFFSETQRWFRGLLAASMLWWALPETLRSSPRYRGFMAERAANATS